MAGATGRSWNSGVHDQDRILRSDLERDRHRYVNVRSLSDTSSDNSRQPLLDPMQIPWYHPHITRNLAEAELRRAEEGVYLMRPQRRQSTNLLKGFAIDVRAAHTVKHFQVNLNPAGFWSFGQETFTSIPAFLEHFDNRPLLGDEGGKLIVLKYAYPRDVEENPDYHSAVTAHFLSEPNPPKKQIKRCQSNSSALSSSSDSSTSSIEKWITPWKEVHSIHSVSLASKEGYLVKMGARVKSWKRRWFVLKDSHLSYYKKETETRPLRVIDLSDATSVSLADENSEKRNVFKVVLPWRTFYFQAQSEKLREEWVELLTWRLREIQQLNMTEDKQSKAQSC